MIENRKSIQKILKHLEQNLNIVWYMWKNALGVYKVINFQVTS
jgi:hypothetical protein